MHGDSSPSLPPGEPTNAPAPAVSLSPSPSSPTVRRRRTQIAKIENARYRAQALCKRRNGLIKKAMNLHVLTGAHVALVIGSTSGKLSSFGAPSVEEVFSEYLRQKDDVTLPMSPKEGVDWAEKGRDSCTAKEDSASFKMVPLPAKSHCQDRRPEEARQDVLEEEPRPLLSSTEPLLSARSPALTWLSL